MNYFDLIGYLSGIVIVISFMTTSLVRKQVYGFLGFIFLAFYAVIIEAWPFAAISFFIAIWHMFRIFGMLFTPDDFHLSKIKDEGEYILAFFDYYENDIRRIFPDFQFNVDYQRHVWLVLRNMVVAGVVVGSEQENSFMVEMDYVIPQYRDLKIGKFLFRKNSSFFAQEQRYTRFVARTHNEKHKKYLLKMGFQPIEDGADLVYIKPL